MPQQPTVPRSAAESTGTEPEPTANTKAADLTVNKVLAGAGAAATSAILGSYFGATGTVAGAAFGSVASTLATTLYQRSLDRTRDTLVARIRLGGGRRVDLSEAPTVQLTVPRPRVSPDAPTTQLRVEPVLRRPRRIWLWAGVTVLVFVIGLFAVTGLEWAKGSSLTTGQPGTSVGRVLTPGSGGHDERNATEPTSERPPPSAEPTTQPAPSAEPTTQPAPTDEATPTAEPTPTEAPGSGTGPTRERITGTASPPPTSELRIPDPSRND